MADDLYQLEFLSLVNKITQEIDNHIGINDKTVAEFVINLHDQSNKSLADFKTELKETGVDFSDSFIESVDRLILNLHPKYKKKTNAGIVNGNSAEELSEVERKKRMFPGLAVKDKEVPPAVANDVFLKELGDLVSGKKSRPLEDGEGPALKRQKRSPSPRRRSLSPPRGRNGRYGNRNGGRSYQVDERPVLFKIYDGKVSGLKEFGAFVTLEGVAGRVEGKFRTSFFLLFLYLLLSQAWCMYRTSKLVPGPTLQPTC
jgi:ATP-dependent RNA helicase DHX8/PRP22